MYRPASHEPGGAGGLERVGQLLEDGYPDLIASKRKMRKVESIECVRLNRESRCQNLGFSSRPFVLCGLPVKRPAKGCLLHERRNGHFVLQVTGHPSYGVPWGQDRLVPIFLATLAIRQKSPRITFDSAAAMLDTFGMQQGGSNTGVWSVPFSGSLERQFSSAPIRSNSGPRSFTRLGSTS